MPDTPLLQLDQYREPLNLLLEQAQAYKIYLAQLSIARDRGSVDHLALAELAD